jgi:hypothetical protein
MTSPHRNTACSIVPFWAVFTELLPGNALMKSFTILVNCSSYMALFERKQGVIHLGGIAMIDVTPYEVLACSIYICSGKDLHSALK